MNIAEEFKHNDFTVRIIYDEDCSSPRENDNLATLACWHRRAKLGDRQISHCTEEQLRQDCIDNGEGDPLAVLPLALYEHGGMTMSVGTSGPCQFDSGQVGWGYVTRSQAVKMGCLPGEAYTEHGTDERKMYDEAFFENAIRAEVSNYDDYLTGQCFGYVVTDDDGDDLDSCWGFVGELEYVRSEAKSAAEHARPLGKVDAETHTTTHDDGTFIRTAIVCDRGDTGSLDLVRSKDGKRLAQINISFLENTDGEECLIVDVIDVALRDEAAR